MCHQITFLWSPQYQIKEAVLWAQVVADIKLKGNIHSTSNLILVSYRTSSLGSAQPLMKPKQKSIKKLCSAETLRRKGYI